MRAAENDAIAVIERISLWLRLDEIAIQVGDIGLVELL